MKMGVCVVDPAHASALTSAMKCSCGDGLLRSDVIVGIIVWLLLLTLLIIVLLIVLLVVRRVDSPTASPRKTQTRGVQRTNPTATSTYY